MTFERYPKFINQNANKDPRPSFWFGLVLFAIGFLLTLISLNIYNPAIVPNELRILSLNKIENIIILGCDEVFPQDNSQNGEALWKGRSDTIAVLSCNPKKNTLSILNIPRDTKVKIPGYGIEKINFLNAADGPQFAKKYLEKILNIRIQHYVVINLHGINKIIDEIGGIYIDVPQRMQYNDNTAMLHINLFPGKQILNGEQAVGFVRFRYDDLGDIGRIQRQQEFMRAVIKKLLDPITFTRLPEIVSIYRKTILTDLQTSEIIRIGNFIRNVPPYNQKIAILPGYFSQKGIVSYWIGDKKEINKLVKIFFYDIYNENKSLSFSKHKRKNPQDIKISIFNGSTKDHQLASKLTGLLREYGYTVLTAQDYESPVKKSKIYAQKANPEEALQVKHDIGNFGELLIGNLGPPEANVTILAGDDLANVKLVKGKR